MQRSCSFLERITILYEIRKGAGLPGGVTDAMQASKAVVAQV